MSIPIKKWGPRPRAGDTSGPDLKPSWNGEPHLIHGDLIGYGSPIGTHSSKRIWPGTNSLLADTWYNVREYRFQMSIEYDGVEKGSIDVVVPTGGFYDDGYPDNDLGDPVERKFLFNPQLQPPPDPAFPDRRPSIVNTGASVSAGAFNGDEDEYEYLYAEDFFAINITHGSADYSYLSPEKQWWLTIDIDAFAEWKVDELEVYYGDEEEFYNWLLGIPIGYGYASNNVYYEEAPELVDYLGYPLQVDTGGAATTAFGIGNTNGDSIEPPPLSDLPEDWLENNDDTGQSDWASWILGDDINLAVSATVTPESYYDTWY